MLRCWSVESGAFDEAVGKQIAVAPFNGIASNQNPAPIRSILASVRFRWGAVALYEHPYMDMEFWDSHAGLYEWSFKPFDITCGRLHFFSTERTRAGASDRDDLAERIREAFLYGLCWSDVRAKIAGDLWYHGFCVLRPTSSFVVSRTALLFDARPISETSKKLALHSVELEVGGQPILTVQQPTEAHLLNTSLQLTTAEFIQQDPHVGPCATASLWVATRRIGSGALGTARFPFSQITHQAIGAMSAGKLLNVGYDPNAGDWGLSTSQIKQAIAQTGWHAFEANPRKLPQDTACDVRAKHVSVDSFRLRFSTFTFVDSGLPALLCGTDLNDMSGHVVAAVGYLRPETVDRPTCPVLEYLGRADIDGSQRHFSLSSAIRVYYAHDDRYGPFSRAIFPRATDAGTEDGDDTYCRPGFLLGRCPEEKMKLARVVVPFPPEVRNRLEGCFVEAIKLFEQEYSTALDSSVLWRCILARGADFKNTLAARDFPRAVAAWYASLHLPKFVWLFELHLTDCDWQQVAWPSGIHGEFLYDATVPYYETHCLARRILSGFWDCREKESLLPRDDEPGKLVLPFDPTRHGEPKDGSF